jgi:hypothetical protein
MAEPTAPAVGTALIFTGASGTAILLGLSAMGIDPERMGAGLFGAIIALAFFPPREVGWRLALLVLASMLLASYAGPIFAPPVMYAGRQIGVPDVHSMAVSCAMVGAFPKPVAVIAQALWVKALKKYGVQDADPTV